jgi:hypothetical protein
MPYEFDPSILTNRPPPTAFSVPNQIGQAFNKFAGNRDLALALLANSSSPHRQSFGATFGQSALMADQMKQQRMNDEFKRQYMQAQIQAMERGKTPSAVQEYEYARKNGYTGSFQDWTVMGGQSSRPSSVQEWEFFSKLDADNQQRYLEMKRNPNFKMAEINQVPTAVVGTPGGGVATTPLSTTASEAAAAGDVARGTAAGKVEGETTTTAKFDLPRVEDNAKQTLGLLDRLKTHKGRAMATGASSMVPVEKLAGTDARDFVTLLGQLRGKQFLEAFNMLKGAGQITEIEGTKAESAIATIQDRGQSEETYLQAIEDLREVINANVARARQKAGGGASPSGGKTETAAERAKRLGL